MKMKNISIWWVYYYKKSSLMSKYWNICQSSERWHCTILNIIFKITATITSSGFKSMFIPNFPFKTAFYQFFDPQEILLRFRFISITCSSHLDWKYLWLSRVKSNSRRAPIIRTATQKVGSGFISTTCRLYLNVK